MLGFQLVVFPVVLLTAARLFRAVLPIWRKLPPK